MTIKLNLFMKFAIGLVLIIVFAIGRYTAPKTVMKADSNTKIEYGTYVLLKSDTIPSRVDVMKQNGVAANDIARSIRSSGSNIADRSITNYFQYKGKIIRKKSY